MFSDVTKISGLGEYVSRSFGVAFVDFDRDNYADLFICNQTDNNFLFRNIGFDKFENATATASLEYGGHKSGTGYGDFNNDGLVDIYVVNAVYSPNFLFQNIGKNTFLNITKSTGTGGEPICSNDLVLGFSRISPGNPRMNLTPSALARMYRSSNPFPNARMSM